MKTKLLPLALLVAPLTSYAYVYGVDYEGCRAITTDCFTYDGPIVVDIHYGTGHFISTGYEHIIIKNGSYTDVYRDSVLYNTTIDGFNNTSSILNLGFPGLAGPGYAYGVTINNGGVLQVYHGKSEYVVLNEGGVQNIISYLSSTGLRPPVISVHHKIEGGTQNIYEHGQAVDTTINSGVQNVFGTTTDTTINGGYSRLYTGGRADGLTTINSGGEMLMEAGSTATDVVINRGTLSITDLDASTTSHTPAQVDKLTMDGGNVSFLRDSDGDFAALNITELSGTGNFQFNSSLAERNSNFVTIENGTGQFGIAVSDSGKEITDHTDLTVNLINDKGGDVDFSMVTANGRSTGAIDGGTYMYTLYSQTDKDGMTGNVWYLGAITEDDNDNNSGGDHSKLKTTPTTDAILSMSTAGLNIMRSELDGLRTYRNNTKNEQKTGEGNVWGHYLGKKSLVDSSNGAAYKLHQNGFELGGDVTTTFDSGNLVTGGFITLSDNRVIHARGGKSKVDSYGLGAYATWYENSGFYIDGVIKANRLESKLNAKMTNGDSTSGNWHQYGMSSALEAGFTFKPVEEIYIEPFIRTSGTYINAANVKLSNGMKANTGKPRSLTAEAGSRVGSQFTLGNTRFTPYLAASVEQELAKSNQTEINDINRFDNNLDGTSGKYGAGMSAQLADKVTLYGEVSYRQGSHIENPVQGTAGVSIRF